MADIKYVLFKFGIDDEDEMDDIEVIAVTETKASIKLLVEADAADYKDEHLPRYAYIPIESIKEISVENEPVVVVP